MKNKIPRFITPVHTYPLGIIGNCSYLAYIDLSANVKWLCMPRFDSSFIFGSLLDPVKGGEFSVKPSGEKFTSKQYYLKNTNILITEFKVNGGAFRVTDFAPRFYQYDRYYKPLMLIRKIEPISGNPFIQVRCMPVGDYGNVLPEMVQGSNHIRYLNLASQVRLTTDVPLNYILEQKSFVLSEARYMVFTYGVPLEAGLANTAETFLQKTRDYWHNWVKTTSIPHIFQEQVIRSALVLKLHQFEDTGGIIAAGTTSLPEHNGSGRTWDYRYCWMRDSYYTLNAFNSVGHFEELEQYFNFIQNIILNEKTRIKPVYTLSGDPVPKEKQINLLGYMGNQPVRIGNNAGQQIQNDVYGQVLVSLLPLFIDNRLNYYDRDRTLSMVKWLVSRIERTMDEPDAGIWEFSTIAQTHTYTFLFHWAGSRAALKIAELFGDESLKIRAFLIEEKAVAKLEMCYDPLKEAYTQAIGSPYLDASGLQLIIMNYLDPLSERAHRFLKAMEQELKTPEDLFFRYTREDDLGKPQTSFLLCSFWYAEALACVGRTTEACKLIQRLISCTNHLGLFSEDADNVGGQWGNFPQTYSHVGLMNAVFRIAIKLDKPIFY